MSNLYNKINDLCEGQKITITAMCRQSGVNRASLTDLKMGRKQSLSADSLTKIADFFNVSVDYLLGKTDIKKAPAHGEQGRDGFEPSDKDIKFALFGGDVSDEAFEEVKNFAAYVKEKYKKEEK